MERGRPKKSWDEVVKEDMKKRGLCISDVSSIKAEQRSARGRQRITYSDNFEDTSSLNQQKSL